MSSEQMSSVEFAINGTNQPSIAEFPVTKTDASTAKPMAWHALDHQPNETEPVPSVFAQRLFCRYEPIERKIEQMRVIVVNALLLKEEHVSDFARKTWGADLAKNLAREVEISAMALDNISKNVKRLVRRPELKVVHFSELAAAANEFAPDAIVMSGTLTDFDFYNPAHLEDFREFVQDTQLPILAICGSHQLVGWAFGAEVVTLDNLPARQRPTDRIVEYQYRFVRILDNDDPIFEGVKNKDTGVWQDYTTEARILRVWQNHGLQLDRVPEGFELLATSYVCPNQMMVRRTGGQLIYTVQFHLEKSFEDWNKINTLWQHPNESRDGRIIFENFLEEAIKHKEAMLSVA